MGLPSLRFFDCEEPLEFPSKYERSLSPDEKEIGLGLARLRKLNPEVFDNMIEMVAKGGPLPRQKESLWARKARLVARWRVAKDKGMSKNEFVTQTAREWPCSEETISQYLKVPQDDLDFKERVEWEIAGIEPRLSIYGVEVTCDIGCC